MSTDKNIADLLYFLLYIGSFITVHETEGRVRAEQAPSPPRYRPCRRDTAGRAVGLCPIAPVVPPGPRHFLSFTAQNFMKIHLIFFFPNKCCKCSFVCNFLKFALSSAVCSFLLVTLSTLFSLFLEAMEARRSLLNHVPIHSWFKNFQFSVGHNFVAFCFSFFKKPKIYLAKSKVGFS